jgi:hypothetical protein
MSVLGVGRRNVMSFVMPDQILAKAIEHFEVRHGRKPTLAEVAVLRTGSFLNIQQLRSAGCMINYPAPEPDPPEPATLAFKSKYGRPPTPTEAEILRRGMKLSIEQVKLAGCMINYPVDDPLTKPPTTKR